MSSTILPPNIETLLPPLLSSLPAASISPTPPTALLPLLSPILRQRVQLLSSTSSSQTDPWLPLLSYSSSPDSTSKLTSLVQTDRLEPHPVSGEVELDYEQETAVQYKRLDEETLQALVTITDLGLSVKLVYCINDEGSDGWRIGEVNALDPTTTSSWGYTSLAAAESAASQPQLGKSYINGNGRLPTPQAEKNEEEEEEDEDYWAQYDNTPAQTPGPSEQSARQATAPPASGRPGLGGVEGGEDEYYAQYAAVQPAMDNHDPDEARMNGDVETSLGKDEILQTNAHSYYSSTQAEESQAGPTAWSPPSLEPSSSIPVAHPRPSTSSSRNSSTGSETVARLEKAVSEQEDDSAMGRETSEVGIKQHIGTSIKSLWRLARVVGMEREEFERVVKTELEVLGMMDED